MPLGFYTEDNQRLVSVTSFLEYVFGIADEIDKWTLKQSILAVQKASKQTKLTQESAIAIGLAARSQKLDESRIRGQEIHQAIQNLHNGIPYELSDKDAEYYSAYFNFYKQHSIEPILEEFRVNNFQYGYAGRLDFYGKLDGKFVLLDFKTSNSVRWTYGLQLACYKKCLEDAGYQVEATYIVHIKPRKRGGIPVAELVEFKYPFEAVKWAIGLFNMKLAFDPFVKWYERSDEAAIAKEKSPTEAGLEVPPQTDVPGLGSSSEVFSPTDIRTEVQPALMPPNAYWHREGKSHLLRAVAEAAAVGLTQAIHNNSQQENPFGENSSRTAETQPGTVDEDMHVLQPGVVVRFEAHSYRTPLEISPLPSAKDISVDPELEWLDEKDTPQPRRQKIA